jgi:sulfite exporter TauE/SafE
MTRQEGCGQSEAGGGAIARLKSLGTPGIRKVVRVIVGVVLILLGLAALLTPLSPGSWLILVGLEFLGLRILLENKLWRWTDRRPNSKISRAIRRLLCLRPRGASGRLKCEKVRSKQEAS